MMKPSTADAPRKMRQCAWPKASHTPTDGAAT